MKKESGAAISQAMNLGPNTMINLYDAFGEHREGLIKDFGFSMLINYNGTFILFDSGTDADILKANVETLGIDLSLVDYAIGSHAHGDHINGFDYLLEVNPEVRIYMPADFFIGAPVPLSVKGAEEGIADSLPAKMRYFDGLKTDFGISQSGRFWQSNVEYVSENRELAPGVRLVFTRSPYLGYFSKYPSVANTTALGESGVSADNSGAQLQGMPELSLSLETEDGEAVIVGCSHSSVQNILAETIAVTGNGVSLLAGGYHMLPYDRNALKLVIGQLRDEFKVKKVAPSHCTGHLAFKLLNDAYGEDYLFAGLGEVIRLGIR